jgi:polyisoprenyl-phosphate glycosyltransferase
MVSASHYVFAYGYGIRKIRNYENDKKYITMKLKTISLVIPCYNEGKNVDLAYTVLKRVLRAEKRYHFEFIFIDNGSLDETKQHILSLTKKDHNVRGIFLSRNFGPEASTQAGFDYAHGDALIWFACDMQEPAEVIPIFMRRWEEGFDNVVGVYAKSEDSWLMRFLRKSFYDVMKLIANVDIPVNSSGFGLYSRKVVEAMRTLPEKYRFQRGIRAWVGFSTAFVTYERQSRRYGRSSYSLMSYFKHAERSVFGFSYLPLDLLIYAGLILVFCSFLFIIGYIAFFFLFGNPIKGAVTILVAIVFFGGLNLLAISVIGKYIQVIVEETKARPTYIVQSII